MGCYKIVGVVKGWHTDIMTPSQAERGRSGRVVQLLGGIIVGGNIRKGTVEVGYLVDQCTLVRNNKKVGVRLYLGGLKLKKATKAESQRAILIGKL